MAERKFPFAEPSSMEHFMNQFLANASQPLKKELEEVVDDHIDADFSSRHEYSPDENAATSSERDESPDTVSNSPDRSDDQTKPLILDDHLKRLLQFPDLLTQSSLRVEEGVVSPSSSDSSSKPGSKIDNLAERLGAVTSSSSSLSSSSSVPSAVSSILGQSAFQPQLGALSALAMQLAASQAAANHMQQQQQSVIQPNPAAAVATTPVRPIPQHMNKQESVGTTPQGYAQSPKRKRQRRNPVWPYFLVEEGIAKCKQCAYSTKSVFSTNLKVHLRSHHRPDYEKVIEAEDQLNLNALLLSGNAAAGLAGKDNRKRSLPPMTSSILMTISKLAAAGQTSALQAALAQQQQQLQQQLGGASPVLSDNEAAAAALRQTLAANQLHQLKMAHGDMTSAFSPMVRQSSASSLHPSTPQPAAVLSTPPTPSPAPTPDLLLQQFGGLAALQNGGLLGGAGLEMPQPKRRRLRRHPVWMFFKDLEDRMVGCINCPFRTGSAFSTNLKMHLKAHHKDDYSKVLKMEDEMRIEEGIFGAPNKIKSELIDFIRGGGNANTPNAPCMAVTSPTPSPLVQQLIAGNFNGRSSPQTPGSPSLRIPSITINNNSAKGDGEEGFSSLPMSDKLAALVGLHSLNGMEREERGEEEKADKNDLLHRLFNNQAQTQSLSMSALSAFNGGSSGVTSDYKSCTSSSVDGSSLTFDDRKCERDRAVARFASAMGENVVSADPFKDEDRENVRPREEEETAAAADAAWEKEEKGEEEVEMDLGQLTLLSLLGLMMENESASPSTSDDLLEEGEEDEDPRVREVKRRMEEIRRIEDVGERQRRMACEKMKMKRLKENGEERKKRLEKMRERYVKRKGGEEKEEEKEEEKREDKGEMEEEKRKKRNEKQKEYQRRKRAEKKLMRESSQEDLLRVLIPEYELPSQSVLASLISQSECHSEEGGASSSSDPAHSERAEPTESPSGDEMMHEEHTPSQFEQLLQSLSRQEC